MKLIIFAPFPPLGYARVYDKFQDAPIIANEIQQSLVIEFGVDISNASPKRQAENVLKSPENVLRSPENVLRSPESVLKSPESYYSTDGAQNLDLCLSDDTISERGPTPAVSERSLETDQARNNSATPNTIAIQVSFRHVQTQKSAICLHYLKVAICFVISGKFTSQCKAKITVLQTMLY